MKTNMPPRSSPILLLLTFLFAHNLMIASEDLPSSINPFLVADLYGQLGNQMFQIATATSLALDHGAEAYFPELLTSEKEGIPVNRELVFSQLKITPPADSISKVHHEPAFTYSPIPFQAGMKIHGYFQSWKYFDHHRKEIQELFAPSPAILAHLESHYGDIIADPKGVAVHIRTYFNADPQHQIYPLNGKKYVCKAMQSFPRGFHFYVFSDDIEWCKKDLQGIPGNIKFIQTEHYIYDFYLQSLCRHNIISNSTFSWWAAYIGKKNSKKIVLAPKEWFQPETGLKSDDLIPPDWFVISSKP